MCIILSMISGCTGDSADSDKKTPDGTPEEVSVSPTANTAAAEETSVSLTVDAEAAERARSDRETLLQRIDTEYNTLQTITVLGREMPDGIAVSALQPPEDTSEFPYIELHASPSAIVLRGWTPTDLSLYVPNGYVSVEVKGTNGGERLEVGFEEIKNGQSVSVTKVLDAEITDEWNIVTIPLAEIVDETDLSGARQFLIGGEDIQVRNITISSPDKEKFFPEFKVNQLGYTPGSEKRALVSGFPEKPAVYEGDIFELVDKTTGEGVYSGQLSMISEFDQAYSGEQILCADFSDFNVEGRYYLRADGIDDSLSFEISESVYDELLTNTMRYYYYQRANEEITAEYGGNYIRSDQTPKDFEAPLSYDRDVTIDVSGGWYDAGDVGKYVSPGATAVNTLLWAYLMFPDCFSDGQNNIPESGNGIPDILDEVRVELDFLLKMQDNSGGFYIKVKSMNENDGDGDRTVWVGDGDRCITNSTADCTAVLAFASKIFREYDPDYADTLLEAAERGWAYIEENPNIYIATNYSGENNASSAFWASACVYYATGSESAHSWFLGNFDSYIGSLKVGTNGHNVGNMGIYGYYTYLLCENREEEVVSKIAEQFEDWKRSVLGRYDANPWRIAINDWSFWWGSFNIILGNAQEMYIGCSLLGLDTSDAEKVSQDAVNFITGVNPMRKCFITGMGESPIKCTFSNIYYGDSSNGVPSGYMPGGINSYNGGIISRFPLKCYYDSANDWFTNENAIYWNAVMVFNSALVVSKSQ